MASMRAVHKMFEREYTMKSEVVGKLRGVSHALGHLARSIGYVSCCFYHFSVSHVATTLTRVLMTTAGSGRC